jgi:quinol monooxygenase YgiN
MKSRYIVLSALMFAIVLLMSCISYKQVGKNVETKQMMIRISEIEIDPAYLEEYKAILREEAEASVRLEPGVISIYPMYKKESPSEIRILEMYANREAYEAHLKTPHFQKYKTTTIDMVKSLRLIDMNAIDPQTMPHIFLKMTQKR